MSNVSTRGHVLACSHGAGPYVLENSKGIVLVTAHWETEQPNISAAAQHDLLFDYPRTLPAEVFEVRYPAPGSPELARKVAQKLEAAGFEPRLDHERGWDHGVYVPMTYLRPQADIPIVQMSILKNQDSADHIKMGRALSSLRDESYTIVCSGSSWHNLTDTMRSIKEKRPIPRDCSLFEAALDDAMLTADPEVRLEKVKNWGTWPGAEYVHAPKHADHFMPFIVAAGSGAPDATEKKASWNLWGVDMATYVW